MTKPDDIPQDVWDTADEAASGFFGTGLTKIIARVIMAERERMRPATVYFERYCQDEADDVENCVCGLRQHEDAKAFAAAIRNRP